MKKVFFYLSFIFLYSNCFSQSINPDIYKARGKKIIELGWDIPTANYIKNNISVMEKSPFDGLCFRYNQEAPLAFEKRLWLDSEMNFTDLSQIQWGNKLTNNFLQLWGQSKYNDPDWYDDDLWRTVVLNMKMFSKAMRISKSKGVFFDSEFYFHNETHSPWEYNNTIFPNKDFNTVKSKVRQRGKEFIIAIQTEMPNIDFMFTYLIGIAWAQSGQSVANLSSTSYALLPAFLEGMMEGASLGAVFIEGNEGSYGYDETRKFTSGYDFIRNANTGAVNLIASDLRAKFNSQGQIAMALYVDQLYGRDGTGWPADYYKKWFVHNVYNGLLVSDQYLWVYSESMDWWKNTGLPTNISDSIMTAKTKISQSKSLGFDMVKLNNYWDIAQATFIYDPKVRITSPANNDIKNTDFKIAVETTRPVSKVEFYINSQKVAEDNSFPYSYDVRNLAKGTYTLFAMAYTVDKNHTTSNPVIIDVNPIPLSNIDPISSMNSEYNRVFVHPNPAQQFVSISNSPIDTDIKLFDLQGREIISEKAVSEITKIDLQALPKGLYLLKVGNVIQKLTVE